jgi:hypothetical protein
LKYPVFKGYNTTTGKYTFVLLLNLHKMKRLLLLPALLYFNICFAQNVGIGTTTPQAKLHVEGDLRVQNGVAINKFSTDSLFLENSHSNIPTEKAIKDYVQKGT